MLSSRGARAILLTCLALAFVLTLSTTRLAAQPVSENGSVTIDKFIMDAGHVQFSSPTLADLTGDGRSEVIIGTTACRSNPCIPDRNTRLYVMKHDGTVLWSRNTQAPINSTAAVGDIDQDGQPEIIVSVGGAVDDINHHGGIIAYDRFGTQLWRFYTQDHGPKDGFSDGVFSSPALCDVDGDGDREIAFGSWDQRIYLLDHNGNSLWNNKPGVYQGPGFLNGDSIWSSPACADLNGDGLREIVIGADISPGGILPDGTVGLPGGFLYVLDLNGNVLVRRYLPEAIYSSPAVGDLDNNGTVEIVVGTGWYWWNQQGRTMQPKVYVFNTHNVFSGMGYGDPNKLPFRAGWPRNTVYPGFSSPAIADLNGDAVLEVIVGTGHPDLPNDAIPGAGKVYAWHHNGTPVSGWPISPKNSGGNDGPIFSSPTVGDIDNDGKGEVLFSMLWDVQVYNHTGTLKEIYPTNWTIWGSPAIGDANNNGKIDIWVGGGNQWSPNNGYLWRFTTTFNEPTSEGWHMFHSDASNSGDADAAAPRLRLNYSGTTIIHQKGHSVNYTIPIDVINSGQRSFNWGTTSIPANVTVSPNNGYLVGGASKTSNILFNGVNWPLGTYDLGVTYTATAPNEPVLDAPQEAPITLIVASQVYEAHFPIIRR